MRGLLLTKKSKNDNEASYNSTIIRTVKLLFRLAGANHKNKSSYETLVNVYSNLKVRREFFWYKWKMKPASGFFCKNCITRRYSLPKFCLSTSLAKMFASIPSAFAYFAFDMHFWITLALACNSIWIRPTLSQLLTNWLASLVVRF